MTCPPASGAGDHAVQQPLWSTQGATARSRKACAIDGYAVPAASSIVGDSRFVVGAGRPPDRTGARAINRFSRRPPARSRASRP